MDNKDIPNQSTNSTPDAQLNSRVTDNSYAEPAVSNASPAGGLPQQPVTTVLNDDQSISQGAVDTSSNFDQSPMFPSTAGSSSNNKKFKILAIVAVIAVILSAAGVALFLAINNKSSNALNCTAPSFASTNKPELEKMYASFAFAAKQSNQACVDSLSSSHFIKEQAMAFPNSGGKWISARMGGTKSVADRLTKLPGEFESNKFKQKAYIQATGSSSSPEKSVEGTTLSYPVTDADGVTYMLSISFVDEDNKTKVDRFVFMPESLNVDDSNSSSSAPTSNNNSLSSPDNNALAKANIQTISVHLEMYFSVNAAYPSNLSELSKPGQDTAIEESILIAPGGVKYAYTPSPSGCTTAAKNCQHYSLSAISTANNADIIMKKSMN